MDNKMLLEIKAIGKQENAGGGDVTVTITATERTELIYGQIGPDDYAANRALLARLFSSGSLPIHRLVNDATIDNASWALTPDPDTSVAAAGDGNVLTQRIILGIGESIQVRVSALADDEEVTVHAYFLIKTTQPTVTVSGTGTPTLTVPVNKVI